MDFRNILTVKNLSKRYSKTQSKDTLDSINLTVTQGSTIALTGESGSGKSTFLNIMAGLEPPSSGEVFFNEVSLWKMTESNRSKYRRSELSIIFQNFNLINSLTVWENISFQAKLSGKWNSTFAEDLLKETGLIKIRNSYPDQRSGCEQQRVAILRSIVAKPKLLLADEPTGNLDDQNSEIITDLLLRLVAEVGSTLIVATHSQSFASKLNKTLSLKNGRLN